MNDDFCFEFTYIIGGRRCRKVFNTSYEHTDCKVELIMKQEGAGKKVQLTIIPAKKLEIVDLSLQVNFNYRPEHRIFVNGYQSWTDSREFFTNEKMRGIAKLAWPIQCKYQLYRYGDYMFHRYSGRGKFHGYTYSYIRQGDNFSLIGSLSERHGFTIIEHHVQRKLITIRKDCKGLCIENAYPAFDIIWVEGGEEFVFDTYFDAMKLRKPRLDPSSGWTSWYQYYQHINEAIILENLEQFRQKQKPIKIFQIDDGYQRAVGDWLSVDTEKFPHGMKYIADLIKADGLKAGIWLAPFICERQSLIFKEKKSWLLKDGQGRPIPAGSNWSGSFILDFYNLEVRNYLRHVFDVVLNTWGYDLVKLDFLYAVCLQDNSRRTRGAIMTEAMEFLRECVGEKLILGCGVPLGPAFGMVDYCRIGSDVGLDWNDKFHMKYMCRERVSTFNAIGNSIGRRHLNGRAFLNDPDVFLLRDENIQLTSEEKYTLFITNWLFGSLFFTSDQIGKYDEAKESLFDAVLEVSRKRIGHVERDCHGLVEVLFDEEDGRWRLALLNLGDRKVSLENRWGALREAYPDNKQLGDAVVGRIELGIHQSKIFRFE